jgi:hypothetical protein
MSTINTVLDALKATIEAATDWKCTTNWDAARAPCVLLYPDEIGEGGTYYEAMCRGVVTIPIVASVIVSSVAVDSQTAKLYDAISGSGPTSIPQAIHQAPTLGRADASAKVASVTEIGPSNTFDGTRIIQAKVHIAVQTRGDS